ncbi:protein shuttle craft [Tribolium castaneum]|uniref:Protein shuttle craft-like Protein n=1 Tax=Tribolium castaneum TaxID=7070 RepID=A0A139WHD1_TRICA|nr:PREDICTED: protein shuttle craft [Tribolium castaneum]KYB27326.1 Protein shuttle craft-like Protein [Tribolium castaneum]|eukprot:XP_970597.2 PREDICTED: protein shuttle craft [Tribolium castaneum]
MSYWGPYEDQLNGGFPGCNPEYVQYFNNMSYYNDPNSANYSAVNYYDGQTTYQNNYLEQPGTSQVTNNWAPNHSNEDVGAGTRKKTNERKYWNNGRKNERYGSGRTFTRSKPEQRKYPENDEKVDKFNQKQDGRSQNSNTRFRNNYRSRDKYDFYDGRGYGKYGKSSRSYEDNGASGRDWRSSNANRKCASNVQKKFDAASQRERLEQMLSRRTLECLVCCEKIKHTDKIWTCQQCYHIFHLNCTIAWANSSKLDSGWRCPACQNVCSDIPKQYTCYCGKTLEPRPLPGVVPHACGELCEKTRRCDHKCTILCHPGPCPDCNVMVAKPCGCGATTQTVKCSADTEIVCGAICGKKLSCGVHECGAKCHVGPCMECDRELRQICYCEKVGRKVKCREEFKGAVNYSCGEVCGRGLSCGNHTCTKVCHEGDCEACPRDVGVVKTCPCGRSELKKRRESCLDPIPCCDKICGKILNCGQPAAPHSCKLPCHEGPCPPCPLTTLIRCRCGHMDREIPCGQVTTKADDARCEKKCTKKRLCGKHRCNQRCCIEIEHICPLPCNHMLACGQHRCERTCHSGRCPPCVETSFDELYCECGANVLYPPIPCGTKPPPCNNPCSRPRPCGHEANHACHTGACPPCTVLCKRWCYGKHEQRSAIPCYQEDFSCGLPCGKAMPCGAHKCDKACHLGACTLPCKQKCNVKRVQCGHPCGVTCHEGPCPDTPCRQMVPVTCPCGLQKATRPCIELAEAYKEIEMAHLKDKMADLLKDQAVDISDINKAKRPSVLKILECTEECRVLERNRRLAIGLQIRNPDLSQKLTPRYSDFMRNWAKKDPQFCQKVHEKLTELVQLAKQSKQKSRSYSFESMNRDKRHFVHEYCEHFGCESAAYDAEPNRNIVATAFKDKSWLPSMSLLEFIQRENGQRKVPGPVLSKGTLGKSETVALKLPGRGQRGTPSGETVDYFDNPPV